MKACAALLALWLAGCASARRGEPLRGPIALDERSARGREVFQRSCHGCHPDGEGGLGPALNNKPLPSFVIRYQVRHGLGTMPSFPKERLSDEDLDAVVAYLKRLRHHER